MPTRDGSAALDLAVSDALTGRVHRDLGLTTASTCVPPPYHLAVQRPTPPRGVPPPQGHSCARRAPRKPAVLRIPVSHVVRWLSHLLHRALLPRVPPTLFAPQRHGTHSVACRAMRHPAEAADPVVRPALHAPGSETAAGGCGAYTAAVTRYAVSHAPCCCPSRCAVA